MGVLDREYSNNFGSKTSGTAAREPGGNVSGVSTTNGTTRGTPTQNFSAGTVGGAGREGGGGTGVQKNYTATTSSQLDRSLKGDYKGTPTDRRAAVSGISPSGSRMDMAFKTNIDITGSSLVPNQLNSTATSGLTKASSTGGPARYKSTTPVAGPKMKSGAQDYSSIVPGTVSFTNVQKKTTTSVPFGQAYPKLAKYIGGTQAKPVSTSVEEAKRLAGQVTSAGGYISKANWAAQMGLPSDALKSVGVTKPGYKTTTVKAGPAQVDISYPGTVNKTTTTTQKMGTFNATPTYGASTGGRVRYTSSAPTPAPKAITERLPGMSGPTEAPKYTPKYTPVYTRSSTGGPARYTSKSSISVPKSEARLPGVTESAPQVVKKTASGGNAMTGSAQRSMPAPKSFSQAFAQARGRFGAGEVFSYKGKQYTTNVAGETGRASGLTTKSSVARTTASKVKTSGGSSIAKKYITNFNKRKAK